MPYNSKITNKGLKYLTNIKELVLESCDNIEESGLEYLKGIQKLIINESSDPISNVDLQILQGIKELTIFSITIADQNIGIHPFDNLDNLYLTHFDCDYLNKNIINSIKNTKNMTLGFTEIKRDGQLIVNNVRELVSHKGERSMAMTLPSHHFAWKEENDKVNIFLKHYYT